MATNVGDVFAFSASFSVIVDRTANPVTRALTTPTTVVLTVTSPSGTVSTYNYPSPATMTVYAVGIVGCDIPLTEQGPWSARIVSTGAAAGAETATWQVNP